MDLSFLYNQMKYVKTVPVDLVDFVEAVVDDRWGRNVNSRQILLKLVDICLFHPCI